MIYGAGDVPAEGPPRRYISIETSGQDVEPGTRSTPYHKDHRAAGANDRSTLIITF